MIRGSVDLHRATPERVAGRILVAVNVCFLFSGATGLLYQVLWVRMLGLVFGHTVFAITTVLAAFMGGLGLGSYLFGRIVDRQKHVLRLYGILEAAIGIYVLATPVLFSWAELVYVRLNRDLHLSFFSFSLVQFLLIFLILLVPTTLMGATLPVLSRFFVREVRSLGNRVGLLYALNTFGAVLGAYLTGFHLIPTVGVRTTLQMGATLNLGIGALVFAFERHLARLGLPLPSPVDETPPRQNGSKPAGRDPEAGRLAITLTVVGFGLSGAVSMIYEVTWTRALALIIGSSTYAFSTMLVAFLTGLALGSFLFSRAARRFAVTPLSFALLQLGIGLGALLLIPLFERMPEFFLAAFRFSSSPGSIMTVQFLISFIAMLLPTVFMGGTFPCAAQIAARGPHRVGYDVGTIYAVNTAGAIAGTIMGGFLLVPLLGLALTIKIAIGLNLGLAAVLSLASRRGWVKTTSTAFSLVAFFPLVMLQQWDPRVMSSGVSVYAQRFLSSPDRVSFREAVAPWEIPFYRDGISSTVSIHRSGRIVTLRVNGKADASNASDMHTQLMSAHIPLLLHPEPKKVLVIGLGSGVTVGAAAQHPVTEIDAIEIEPAVAEASKFFVKENRDVLKDPRVRLTIADGRNFILSTRKTYDVIISEPSNPWIGGIGSLFSLEFYGIVAGRLAPNGIICQWVQGYNLFPQDLQMVVKTLRSVFPHTTIWNTSTGDYLLIGSRVPLSLDYARLEHRYQTLPTLREDMARLALSSPLSLLADFVLSEEDTARYANRAWLNTDDLPLLEFSAPNSLYADTVALNTSVMEGFKTTEFPPGKGLDPAVLDSAQFRYDLGMGFVGKGRPQRAREEFDKALRVNPRHVPSLLGRGKILLDTRFPLRAQEDFRRALAINPREAEAYVQLAIVYRGQGMPAEAERHLRKAVGIEPNNARYLTLLADLYRAEKKFQQALPRYLAALESRPEDVALLEGASFSYRELGRLEEAVTTLKRALTTDERNANLHFRLGEIYARMKQYDAAIQAFAEAARLSPLLPAPHVELGRLYLVRKEQGKAIDAWERALRLDPSNVPLRRQLEDLYATAS
jgi:spermidine synthase